MFKKKIFKHMARFVGAFILVFASIVCAGCSHTSAVSSSGCSARRTNKICVVTTTGVLRDMVAHVAADAATVTSIIPDNADPHSYEPSLASIRNIVYADIAFSNYMLLEEHSIITALDSNVRKGVANVQLAEESVKNAADIIPMVEDVSLDTIWLGLATERVERSAQETSASDGGQEQGRGNAAHASIARSDQIRLTATQVSGLGDLFAYLTGTFGKVDVYINSADGIDARDHADLPADAHTHLSWAFSKPGVYTLDIRADHYNAQGQKLQSLASTRLTFAVGVNATQEAKKRGASVVLNQGHADLAYNIVSHTFSVRADDAQSQRASTRERIYYAPGDVIVEVPSQSIKEIPAGHGYSFLGAKRSKIYQLPQAVLGKHVHGDIDPHLWQSVSNGIAYVKTIADRLSQVDPKNEATYRRNAAAYIEELMDVDDYVRSTIASIPQEKRNLVTTHDAFAYLGKAYNIKIAGFVTINPSSEPSIQDRKRLAQTLRDLKIPAVFLEPNLLSRSSVLQQIAHDNNIQVCPIYGDSFDAHVHTYAQMMRENANSLKRCLDD
ncbi:anchored repeat ABC transporter, substrate-binding protein [Alloscardovia omnicolens]|uniref:anchored repeat ABC transporter, substrate-binding protein n=1 Tax=Alloscardovia omnicolens TaxID=419015 RepID=UPI003A66C4CE